MSGWLDSIIDDEETSERGALLGAIPPQSVNARDFSNPWGRDPGSPDGTGAGLLVNQWLASNPVIPGASSSVGAPLARSALEPRGGGSQMAADTFSLPQLVDTLSSRVLDFVKVDSDRTLESARIKADARIAEAQIRSGAARPLSSGGASSFLAAALPWAGIALLGAFALSLVKRRR